MTLVVAIIPADSDQPIERREIEGKLEEYQRLVGGTIAFTDIPTLEASLVSHDEGLLISLPVNERATELLYEYAPEHEGWTLLVGTVVVVGLPDEQGDTQSASDRVLSVLGV